MRESTNHGELSVLILSSNVQRRQLVRTAIGRERQLRAMIAECEDAAAALSRMRDHPFDLIVLDTNLHDLKCCVDNGGTAAIVFLAAAQPGIGSREIMAAGATDCYLNSEYGDDPDVLALALRQSLRCQSLLRSSNHLTKILHDRDGMIAKLCQRLWRDAAYDFRTGWFSRREIVNRLHEELHRSVRYKLPLAVVLGAMDAIEDLEKDRGEQFVDSMFAQISSRIRSLCRQSDVVGHWGGDRFLVLLTNTEIHGARRFCQRLNISFEKPIAIGEVETSLQVRFGVAARELGENSTVAQLLEVVEANLEVARETNPPQGYIAD